MKTSEQFGNWVKDQRTKRDMKAYELADKLEVTRSYVSKIENGATEHPPSATVLHGIAKVFNVSYDEVYSRAGYYDATCLAYAIQHDKSIATSIRRMYEPKKASSE